MAEEMHRFAPLLKLKSPCVGDSSLQKSISGSACLSAKPKKIIDTELADHKDVTTRRHGLHGSLSAGLSNGT